MYDKIDQKILSIKIISTIIYRYRIANSAFYSAVMWIFFSNMCLTTSDNNFF